MDEEERRLAIVSALQGNEPVETDEEPDEEIESESAIEESDPSDSPEEEDESLELSDDDEEFEEGHRVPYNRFKQINDQRREYREQAEQHERMIAQLQEQLKGKAQAPQQEAGETFWEEESYEELDEISMLRKQQETMQVKFATMELEKEIAAAREQYPGVPEEHIWESIAQDGNQRAEDIAKHYSSMVAEIEEAAIARYLKSQGEEVHGAPPRPSRKQTAKSNPSDSDEWKPQNTDEAREAMIAYLRS
jgi:hypothetical protein